MKHKNNDTPSIIRNHEIYINDPITTTNTLNNFFTSISEIVQSKIKFLNKSFRNVLSIKNNDSSVHQIVEKFYGDYCPCLYLSIAQVW